jgi:hypothetical protein
LRQQGTRRQRQQQGLDRAEEEEEEEDGEKRGRCWWEKKEEDREKEQKSQKLEKGPLVNKIQARYNLPYTSLLMFSRFHLFLFSLLKLSFTALQHLMSIFTPYFCLFLPLLPTLVGVARTM